MPIRFPITDLLSENECYEYLLDALHPEGLHCPQGHARYRPGKRLTTEAVLRW